MKDDYVVIFYGMGQMNAANWTRGQMGARAY